MKKDVIFSQCKEPDRLARALYAPRFCLLEDKENPYYLALLKLNLFFSENNQDGIFGVFLVNVKKFPSSVEKTYFFKIGIKNAEKYNTKGVYESHIMDIAKKYQKHAIDRVAFLENLKIKLEMDGEHFSWLSKQGKGEAENTVYPLNYIF